jgi:hypothetical protein
VVVVHLVGQIRLGNLQEGTHRQSLEVVHLVQIAEELAYLGNHPHPRQDQPVHLFQQPVSQYHFQEP